MILVKELVLVDKSAGTRAGELRLRALPYLRSDTSLYDMHALLPLWPSSSRRISCLLTPRSTTLKPYSGRKTLKCPSNSNFVKNQGFFHQKKIKIDFGYAPI